MKNKWWHWLVYILGVGGGLFILLFVVSSAWIGYEVNRACLVAEAEYDMECVPALMEKIGDDSKEISERNHAVWALGQMGDKQALPVLEDMYQGDQYKCDHDKELCQYEIAKAINLLNSGFNATTFVWRR